MADIATKFGLGAVKSIQAFQISYDASSVTSGTATITSVSTSRSYVIQNGFKNSGTNAAQRQDQVTSVLTNATTVTASQGALGSGTVTVNGWVVEFY